MSAQTSSFSYHVLLVGIDRYPPRYRSLRGCVNDIDAIEQLLFEPPGIGIPAEQIRVTRLAAPRAGQTSMSRFEDQTLPPTRANLVQALQDLAGPAVKPADRVLIYYAGHGDERLWTDSPVWHEALVPHNGQEIEYLFDVEINALVNAIAARTDDLTIVLDCCHSAGATRDLGGAEAQGQVRSLGGDPAPVAPPDLARLGPGDAAQDRGVSSHLLQSPDPSYLVVVACQSDEKAGEGAYPYGQPSHGVFTHSLLSVLGERDADERAALRWADIWPALLARATKRSALVRQRAQHPWVIGRSERKVFGGPWEKMDAGYRVTQWRDGGYDIGAGQLMGVTEGAEIAVYGPEPRLLPKIGSQADRPVGRLKVRQAGPSSAVAAPLGEPFEVPDGARGRLAKPGQSQRLRVSLEPADAEFQVQLEASPLLEVVSSEDPHAEVEVVAQLGGRWIIGNDTEPVLAVVPPGEVQALRAGLEHYYRYNTVLRMAHNCSDPQMANSLSVQVLDCNDKPALLAMSPGELADPALPEAPRDHDRIYTLQSGFEFCVRVTNSSRYHLNVFLLNSTAGGIVEYLSDALLRDGAAHVMWLDNKFRATFQASPESLPAGDYDVQLPTHATDRMIAIGTTRHDVDLRFLTLDKGVQEVVDENLAMARDARRFRRTKKADAAPSELWTATVAHIRIARG
ncbi:MAG: caspase family protein [Anaerolineae bacterium]|nr:caspase family protein [Anaerolineae bacterium]